MSKGGLGGGEIAGIVIGSVAAAAIIVFGGIFAWNNANGSSEASSSGSGTDPKDPDASRGGHGSDLTRHYEFVNVPSHVINARTLREELDKRLRIMAHAHEEDGTNIDGLLKYAADYAGFLAKCNHGEDYTLVRAMVIQLYALVRHRANELREGAPGKRGIEVTDILTKVKNDIDNSIMPMYCERVGDGCWHHRAHQRETEREKCMQ